MRGPAAATLTGVMRSPARCGLVVAAAALAAVTTSCSSGGDLAGRDVRVRPSHRPAIEAAFAAESYRAGAVAELRIWSRGDDVTLQVFRAATEADEIVQRDVLEGTAMSEEWWIGNVRRGRVIRVAVGDWPGGLYYALLSGSGDRIGYAPFVLRPRRLGEHPVAVVLPTMTWQAYNFHDDNHDGVPDTWYYKRHAPTARLARPFENRGVPPHYKFYDQPFLRWLIRNDREVDYLADADLADSSTTGRKLAAAYELLVFPGHHEYVTTHEYDAVTGFRNLGGNLMFLSANNFFWRVIKRGNVMHRKGRWRDLGRPEAALIGVQYFGNDEGQHRGAWIVRANRVADWIFSGTTLDPGSRFGQGGIEADRTAPASPRSTKVVAEIPNLFGTGKSAQMTYYETPAGAKVFAAGAFTLAGSVWWPDVRRVMTNLWTMMANDGNRKKFVPAPAPTR